MHAVGEKLGSGREASSGGQGSSRQPGAAWRLRSAHADRAKRSGRSLSSRRPQWIGSATIAFTRSSLRRGRTVHSCMSKTSLSGNRIPDYDFTNMFRRFKSVVLGNSTRLVRSLCENRDNPAKIPFKLHESDGKGGFAFTGIAKPRSAAIGRGDIHVCHSLPPWGPLEREFQPELELPAR